jgi:hypothetical protein
MRRCNISYTFQGESVYGNELYLNIANGHVDVFDCSRRRF